jgi:hypothetical protein
MSPKSKKLFGTLDPGVTEVVSVMNSSGIGRTLRKMVLYMPSPSKLVPFGQSGFTVRSHFGCFGST